MRNSWWLFVLLFTGCSSPCVQNQIVNDEHGAGEYTVTLPNCEQTETGHFKYTYASGLVIEGDVLNGQYIGVWNLTQSERRIASFAMLNETLDANLFSDQTAPLCKDWWNNGDSRMILYQRNGKVWLEGRITRGQRVGNWNQYSTQMDTVWSGKFDGQGTESIKGFLHPFTGTKNGIWTATGSRNIPLATTCFASGIEVDCP